MSREMLRLSACTADNIILGENIDGGKAPRVTLNDGTTMPVFGLGMFLGFDERGQKEAEENEVKNAIKWAFDAGYRMIDTAAAYRDEREVGRGVQQTSVPREHVYIVTKLDPTRQRHVLDSLRDSLKLLNMSYVDLYLIHSPVAFMADHKNFDVVDYLDTWKSMEEAKKLGLAKSIGLSNFNISQIERILANCEIKPSVLQVEVNLNLAQNKLIDFSKEHDIYVMAYTPFGSLFTTKEDPPPPRADDPTLTQIADKYNKTTPQIVLKYLLQRGLAPIPKSIQKVHIEQNIDIFDFELTSDEMEMLDEFNKDYRSIYPTYWQDHPYYPYEKKDVPDSDPFKGEKE